jgi:hypothetical protein
MALSMTCPACRATVRVPDAGAARETKCPRCQAPVPLPAAEPLVAEAAEPTAGSAPAESPAGTYSGPTKPCPSCGNEIAIAARKCRFCKTWLEQDDEDDDGDRSYRPCPRCGSAGARRVIFTFWGSFYGPALFSHVRCPQCNYAYNGRTGRSNRIPAIIFVTVPLLLIVGILGGLAILIVAVTR